MEYTLLGRTGLKVPVMGLGCGGPSRAGQRGGRSEGESVAVIRQALDRGVNFIDTAESYGTEEIVGKAIKEVCRDSVVISTKKRTQGKISQGDVEKSLEESLNRLGTDYVDFYHLHGVDLQYYDYLAAEIVPLFEKMRTQGKLRFIGITEPFVRDPGHAMLQRALEDDFWDVMMVGFNMLNPSARDRVLKKAKEKNIGILIMFAVRLAFSRPERLRQIVEELIEKKKVDPSQINKNDPLGFLIHEGGAVSLTDAAYRFCRHEPETHVILSGTGNPDHLGANIESFSRPPLPPEDLRRLTEIFGHVDSVSGE
jgi:L-galactose dehydrogenase